MEVNENWEIWKPINNLSNKYELDFISDEIGKNLKIILSDAICKSKVIQINFKHSNDYRITYINFGKKKLFKLNEKYGNNFHEKWTFFKVYNSEYLKWLSDESFTITDTIEFEHLCLITSNVIIDIISGYEPDIEFIYKN